MIEQNHLDLLLDLNTDENPHSGGGLLDHLRGTHDFLQTWGNDQAVCLGGKPLLSPLAYEAIKAGIGSKRIAIASSGER